MKIRILILLLLAMPSFAFVDSLPSIPKVLIIGDSISIGYFPYVRELLRGKADVIRPFKKDGNPENCQGTTYGLVRIDEWIGETQWDVIHFNFGLHDLKHVNPETGANSRNLNDPLQANLEQYEINLNKIVTRLKETGATLIFATTTPYDDSLKSQIRDPGMSRKYNEVAIRIMKKHHVKVNDLYSFTLPRMKQLQLQNNVHFTEQGSKALAEQVVQSIHQTMASGTPETDIDREELVIRHQVENNTFDTLGSLTVGNGGFAFTVDFTGLQTFPAAYKNGIPLGTQSDWGWHSFTNDSVYRIEETLDAFLVHEREITYSIQVKNPRRRSAAADYFRINPHRLHLGIVGFNIKTADGETVDPEEISEIEQVLDLWKGEIRSSFKVLGAEVEVITVCHPEIDAISFRAQSKLIENGQLTIGIRFPFPSGMHADMACRWDVPEKHSSHMELQGKNAALIERNLDTTRYFTLLQWAGELKINETDAHAYELSSTSDMFEVTVQFSHQIPDEQLATFQETRRLGNTSWNEFWMSGGAVDFSGSFDPRAEELERRVVLSQYLTRAQCAGSQPPQETGLTYNSWYGKFHLEMAWWHMVHFFLWDRTSLMEESLSWFESVSGKAKETAIRQGYDGVRWQKMTGPNGNDSPSSVGSFLIWQQPHIIYFAELYYRQLPDKSTLERFKDLVYASADFMASYAWYNPDKSRYELGPTLIPAQECFDQSTTYNPPFELSYWYWGLNTAIQWSLRLGESPNPDWVHVMEGLSPLYSKDGLYVPAESVPQAYQEGTHMRDHPAVLGAFGALPDSPLFDMKVMQHTFDFVWENWRWEETWGWDFPLTAMTAVRLGDPERAMDALFMDPVTNRYLKNGHNYQTDRLRLYLPGNGGLLATVALMCAGYDGCTIPNPGIPRNGQWKVKWEGLLPMP